MKFSALGLGISFLLLLVPLLHLVTGAFGPFVGGLIAGSKAGAEPREGVLIGLGMGFLSEAIMGLVLALIALTPVRTSVGLASVSFMLVILVTLLIAAYIALGGAVGALVGGRRARRAPPRLP